MNQATSKTHKPVGFSFANIVAMVLLTLSLSACAKEEVQLQAQSTSPVQVKPLSDAEIKSKYRTCPGGYYSGPQPGKQRFTKDPWLWVISPEFAAKFCMPEQFVNKELKGAEAVAFRILNKADQENCGFGGNSSVCAGETVLRFEVYVKSDAKLPKIHNSKYYEASNLPSSMLIARNTEELLEMNKEAWKPKPKGYVREIIPGLTPHFEPSQIGISGIKDGIVAWPVVQLYQKTYFANIRKDLDYYAFEGSTGFFGNPGIKQNNVKQFVIEFLKLDYKLPHTLQNLPISEFAYIIDLPQAFTDKVIEAERTKGLDLPALAREAFKIPSAPSGIAKP
jgi:hypothetical protein